MTSENALSLTVARSEKRVQSVTVEAVFGCVRYGRKDCLVKEYEMDGSPDREANEMYVEMVEMSEPPSGGYKL